MKKVELKDKTKNKDMQCVLCQANFQAWLDNLQAKEDRKEKISSHFLEYCPVCVNKKN